MSQEKALADLERRAAKVGKPLYLIARQAGLAPSTYYRWKGTAKASYDNMRAVEAEMERLEKLAANMRKANQSRITGAMT